MVRVRSSHAKRGRTGRAVRRTTVRRRVQVRHHHHRRYAGIRHGPRPGITHRRHGTMPRPSRTGTHHRFLGRRKHVGLRAAHGHALRHALKGRHGHRHFRGRKKALHKRHLRHGLHRHFRGRHNTHKRHMRHGLHRRFHGRHVKHGLHRRFHGRKTTHHRGHPRPQKNNPAPISASSYLSMF